MSESWRVRWLATLLAAGVIVPASHAALPSTHNLGTILPTPSGIVDTRYRDGNDGSVAIPLLWGTCPTVSLTVGGACTTDLRTACTLIEAGSPDATLSLLSGTLPADCSISGDGITGTVGGVSDASVVVRATRNADTADTLEFRVVALASGTDSTAPTIPLQLVGTDNADGTGVLTWLASSDPQVSGIADGIASYRVQLDGSPLATVTSGVTANVRPALTAYEVGADTGESSTQSGADWSLTYSGTGLGSTTDNVYGRWTAVTGDYTATTKISAYTPTVGTAGSIGIAARASNSAAGSVAIYSRWRDTDDRCNQRYRLTTGGGASNGTLSTATYSVGSLWVMQTRVGDVFSTYCSSDGITFTLTSSQTVSAGATVYVGPFITSGSTGNNATGTAAQINIQQSGSLSYAYTGAGGSFTVSSYDGTNRSAESAAVVLQPTGAVAAGEPTKFVAARATATSAELRWKAPESGGTPTQYRVYQASSQGGAYSLVYSGLPTPHTSLATYTTTISSGIDAAEEPWFKITAVVGGVESAASAERKLSIGATSVYADSVTAFPDNSTATAPSATALFGGVSATSADAFGSIDYNATPADVGGDRGMRLVKNRLFGGKWAIRAQLTFHTYGNNSPTDLVSANPEYSAVTWQTKADTAGDDRAHRNEFTFAGGMSDIGHNEEHWLGFAVYLPGTDDDLGDAPSTAWSTVPGNYVFGPQLHPTNTPGNNFNPVLAMRAGTDGYTCYGSTYCIEHPAGAPVVRFKRGGEQPLGAISSATLNTSVSHTVAKSGDASTLLVEWDAVVGASSYRVEYAWRPEGVWTTASTDTVNNITVDTANRRVIVTGLGDYTACFADATNCRTRYIRVVPIIDGEDGTTSLIAPAPRWHWGWHGGFSIDSRADRGRWVRWVLRYMLGANSNGYYEVWKDDVKVASRFGVTLGSANPTAPYYWKMGFYTGYTPRNADRSVPPVPMDWPWRRIVYFDEVRALERTSGSSAPADTNDSAYQQVRPRGGVGQ